MSSLTIYDTIALNLKINEIKILILIQMPICGTKMVLIDQEMHKL